MKTFCIYNAALFYLISMICIVPGLSPGATEVVSFGFLIMTVISLGFGSLFVYLAGTKSRK